MDQNPNITLSNPKEPNLIASHKGTFVRDDVEPNWTEYESFFSGAGLRMDASVHTFGCPIAPTRILERFPKAKFILCLREPVSRAVSHWNMVRNTGEAEKAGRNWSSFEKAWDDESLRVDSFYGSSIERWLEKFDRSRFLIVDSSRMRGEPKLVLNEIGEFLGVENWEYEFDMDRHANSAEARRPLSGVGVAAGYLFSLIPNLLKRPIVGYLQKRDLNIYRLPILSRKGFFETLNDDHYRLCGEELREDLVYFGSQTGFDVSAWVNEIRRRTQ
tara:strand:+ start:1922 stop:2740 length:819 start_codon:yes stop_codon:yes gene_type:complete